MKEIAEAVMGNNDIYVANDGKIVLDFLQAIHTAEKRQEDLDARIFSEEKRLLKARLFVLKIAIVFPFYPYNPTIVPFLLNF